jgi:PAS domain S-box-containing protein
MKHPKTWTQLLKPRQTALLSALVVLVISLIIWAFVSDRYHGRQIETQRAQVLSEVAPYGNALSAAVNQRFALLEGLRVYISAHIDSPQELEDKFPAIAEGLYNTTYGIRNFAVAPDGINWLVYPLEGNESVIGHDLVNDERPNVRADVQRTIESGLIVLSGPYELRQGGLGLVARRAIYVDGQFWGLVTMVLDMESVLTEAGFGEHSGLLWAIKIDGGSVFYGNPDVFEQSSITHRIEVPQGFWVVAGIPENGWNAAVLDSVFIFQAAGFIIVLLLTALSYLVVRRQARLVFAVAERTRLLHTTNQNLEHEIAERKQAEVALRASEGLWRSLTETSPDHILTLDADLNIEFANFASPGLTVEDLIGTPLYTYVDKERRDEIRAILESVLKTGEPTAYETKYALPDDGIIYYESRVTPRILHGDKVGLTVSARDITSRKDVEQQRLELALERERMEILSNFISKASHEFKTPLSTINTSAYLLTKITDPDMRKQKMAQIEDQVNDIATLIDALITMSQLDVRQDLTLAHVNLNEIIQEACDLVQSSSPERNIRFVLDLTEDILLLLGSYEYLELAISNIIKNAIHYTSERDTITVSSCYIEGNALIKIVDTGVGISEDNLSRIFERFYREDVAGTTRGFGLGLPIAKAAIERHGGTIEVESTAGEGSTFKILLPIFRP